MKINIISLALFVTIGTLLFSCNHQRYQNALSPEEELKHFDLEPGFSIEKFASEPQVQAPVAMVFDEQGTIYVLEMADYPYKPDSGKGAGRIRVLRDTNNDGIIDTAIVFAQGLPSATSMLPWKGGLIVTAAPDILYFKDTTGDFHADTKEILFTGFFANNSEAQITSLRFGIDNWIYANNHGQAGTVRFLRKPDMPAIQMSGSDFRFRLDQGLFEKVAGSGQFGMAIDDWGHRFYTQNTLHIQQAPIAWKYLHRHDFLASDNADVNISDHESVMFQRTPPPYWRLERSNRRQKEYDDLKLDRKEYAAGHFTGASGGTFYSGDAFPTPYYGSVFTGEVAGNLVHRDKLVAGEQSPAFVAQRDVLDTNREFLASSDPWFRPTNFSVGPDGYLYMLDMYRQHIETPVSIPDDLKKDMDFANGDQYGRIYRIFPAGNHLNKSVKPQLRNATSAALVELLEHPNQWWCLQAQQLLFERHDTTVIGSLQKMFLESKNAKARMHALYTLEGLNALSEDFVNKAMKDPEPGIREQGIVLSERYPQSFTLVLDMVNDPSLQVVLQAVLTIGNSDGQPVMNAFDGILNKYGKMSLFRTAVLSSNTGASPAMLKMLINQHLYLKDSVPGAREFIKGLAYSLAARNQPADLASLVAMLEDTTVAKQESIINGALEGICNGLKNTDNKKYDPEIIIAFDKLKLPADSTTQKVVGKIKQFLK